MKHIKKFNELNKIPSNTNREFEEISDEFNHYADLMIKANDGDLNDGYLQTKANEFFIDYNIDTSQHTNDIIDKLFDILGNNGVSEMKDILEEK
jgi:hypothetical protein